MNDIPTKLASMIEAVAKALGPDTVSKIAFVGGCTTGLLMTDSIAKEAVRYTQDVDLIIDIIGYSAWTNFQEDLRKIGFKDSMDDGPICRMNLGELKVDFMPIDPDILGFSNSWYEKALETAEYYDLTPETKIRLLTPPLFIATKFEAYLGRGNNDPLDSNDVEDILNLFDGRPELVREIQQSDKEVQSYISSQIRDLLSNELFDYAVESHTRNHRGRADIIYKRLEKAQTL